MSSANRWYRPGYLLGLLLLCMSANPLFAADEFRPALWHLKTTKTQAYLFGSIHFGQSNFYPLPEAIENAFAQSTTLVVEIDIEAIPPLTVMQKAMHYGMLAPDQSASAQLGPSTWEQVENIAREYSLPSAILERQKPWFIAITLTSLGLQRMGLDPNRGIDQYFLSRRASRAVIGLETLDSQLGAFDSLPVQTDVALLAQTLRELGEPAHIHELISAWRSGDDAALQRLLTERHFAAAPMQAARKILLDDRNLQMTRRIVELLETGGRYFIVVGAGHFVGAGSIIERLRRDNYPVERVN